MSPSQAPPESPDKAEESPVEPGALSRFKRLASHLFGLDQGAYREAVEKDEKERAKRRALNPKPPGRRTKP